MLCKACLAPQLRPAAASRKAAVSVLAKGFAGDGGHGNVRVNERGKVSSRPGPPSRKQMKQQQEGAKQQPQEQEGAAPAAPMASSSGAAPAAPPSSSAPSSPPQRIAPPRMAPQVTETPQAVVDRMFGRMVLFAATPVFLGVAMLVVFYYLKLAAGDEFPMWTVYASQAFAFGGGLLGISYGILSTSWDPAREGSMLGWTEFQANLPLLLNRNKQNP